MRKWRKRTSGRGPAGSSRAVAALKIIIDTDPGQDDAAAIMLALGSPEIEVLGITAVAGNVPLALTARNARIVCEMCERSDVKVFAGADRPLRRARVTAEHAHGKSGLDGPALFEPSMPLHDGHAVDFLVETVMREAPGTVSLSAIGPRCSASPPSPAASSKSS